MPEHLFERPDQQWESGTMSTKYRQTRSAIPKNLIQRLMDFLSETLHKPFGIVVDVGCGTGQSTEMLSHHFQKTIGIDPCKSQIEQAKFNDESGKIDYRVGHAEMLPVAAHSVDLITAMTSAHWFEHQKFSDECARVLKPGGVLAVVGYDSNLKCTAGYEDGDNKAGQKITEIIRDLKPYLISAGCYHPNIRHLINKYSDMDEVFSFTDGKDDLLLRNEEQFREVRIQSLDSLLGYISTWSGAMNHASAHPERDFIKETRQKMIVALENDRIPIGDPIRVEYPWFLLAYRKPTQRKTLGRNDDEKRLSYSHEAH